MCLEIVRMSKQGSLSECMRDNDMLKYLSGDKCFRNSC